LSGPFDRARGFIYTQARLLERLLFAVRFQKADPAAVGRLISAYQNPDGGLGHALDPDLRCPESQPLFVEIGLSALRNACFRDPELSLVICCFLESISDAEGLVPILLPSALKSPHASHWRSTGEPGLNPTASICGLLHYQGVDHPWLSRATQTCCELLLHEAPKEVHALLCAAHLAEHLPDERAASLIAEQIRSALPESAFYIAHAPVQTYGLTPLHFSPTPTSRWRDLFTDEQVDGHLAHLMAMQQADGGWPITWEAPGPASTSEYRGSWTLAAVSTLVDYGLIAEREQPATLGRQKPNMGST
jgi:hypothetical protein